MTKVPSKDELRDWIAQNPAQASKRDIARAFGVKGSDRVELKRLLRELEAEGLVERRRKSYRDPDGLPPVTVLTVADPDSDGDLFAKPMEWQGSGPPPRVLIVARNSDPALGAGDRILARITAVRESDHGYEGRLIRKIGTNPRRILGVFRREAEGGRILPVEKGADREWRVAAGADHGAQDGELVEAESAGPRGRLGTPPARVVERLGDPSAPKAVSLIAIHQHGIPDSFPDSVIAEADAMTAAHPDGREDLTELALVTIDPADARDHDDAVHAHPDADPENPGGYIVWVAIADVAHHVRPGTELDREAHRRGNSTYFPDRVVPMLPDRLSADLCSLHEGVDRPCIAVRLTLDAHGEKIAHRFTRGWMRSHAALTYSDAQSAADGAPTERAAPLAETVIAPLFAAWRAAHAARIRRAPLDLDLPERRIVLGADGRVESVAIKDRRDAHRVIEEFMVLANVSAAEELKRLRWPLLFRVHEEPSPEKLEALREVAQASGFTLAKGQVLQTRHLNRLLAQSEGTEFDELINMSTLRSMTQAYYTPENFGHFGLALRDYAHFTSPIRRYSDLIVHRALISAHGWGEDGLSTGDMERLHDTARHISETERRSMAAERDTADRYLAAFLADRVGNEFTGRISGITRFGVFVRLADTGADGLIPIRTLGREYFHFDADEQTLMGEQSGLTLALGNEVLVRLAEATPITGGLTLELLEIDGKKLPRVGTGRPRRGANAARQGAKARRSKLRRARQRDRQT